MKKSIWILGLGLVLLFNFGFDAQAQPKEVTESLTTTYYVPAKVLPLGEGRAFMSYEGFGVTVSDTGEGLFHEATIRVLGSMTIEKGVYNDERGWGVWNLKNGDKVFFNYRFAGETRPAVGGKGKGTVTFSGGTGKCAGIQGTFEAERYTLVSALEGVGQTYTKAKVKYNLP